MRNYTLRFNLIRFLFPSILVIAGICNVQAQGLVSDQTEFEVLKDLYDDLGGQDWSQKTNWPVYGSWPSSASAAEISTWYGITVENGDITSISLVGNNLVGELPPSLNSLTSLRGLGFGYNNLNGAIPDLSALHSLESLDLSVNPNLTVAPLPSWIGTLTQLRGINLFRSNVTGTFPANFRNLTQLEFLNMSQNGLEGPIPEWIGELTHLHTLNLNTNQFSGSVPESICNLTNMEYLEIALCGNIRGKFPQNIGNLKKLKVLSFWLTNMEGHIPTSINELEDLEQLQLFQTRLSGALPKMDKLKKLWILNLQYSQFSGTLDFLKELPSLQYTSLSGNKFSGEIPLGLPVSLNNLSVDHNSLTGNLPADLPLLVNMQTLNAGSNLLTGSIPDLINEMDNLVYVDLSNNGLTSITPGAYSRAGRGHANWSVYNNHFTFPQLEAFTSNGVNTSFVLLPQKEVQEPTQVGFKVGQVLTIPVSVDKGQYTTIAWEKKSGNDWIDVSSGNEDASGLTYKRNSSTQNDVGTYRWKMTNSLVTGGSIYSTPMRVDTEMQLTLDNYAFQYKYDGRKRMTHKKVPGADWVYMVYDDRDRLVFTQDGEQRKSNKWNFTKYDALNRPVITGIYDPGATFTQGQMQQQVNDFYTVITASTTDRAWFESYTNGVHHGYNNLSYPMVYDPASCLTITYYDNYDFASNWGEGFNYSPGLLTPVTVANGSEYQQEVTASTQVIGQVTGTKVRTVDAVNDNNIKYLKAITYYDDKYRPVQVIADNDLGGTDRTTNIIDFVGKVLKTETTQTSSGLKWKDTDWTQYTSSSVTSSISGQGSYPKSQQTLTASTNGWLEFKVNQWDTPSAYVSLVSVDEMDGFTILIAQTTVQIWENGNYITSYTTFQPDDVFRIERTGDAITYKIKGANGLWTYTSQNHSTKELRLYAYLDSFSGIQDIRTSFAPTFTCSTERMYTYDHAGRLLTTHHSIDGATPLLLVKNEYNELGQLIDKNLHSTDGGTTFKQSTDYRYNIRGWLTSINNAALITGANTNNEDDANNGRDLFGMELYYEKPVATLTTESDVQFNGNISAIAYSNNLATGTIKSNGYKFDYDPMNRLKESNFRQRKLSSWSLSDYVVMDEDDEPQTLSMEAFSERGFKYDLNGNIQELQRSGSAGSQQMDDIKYHYQGNQLLGVNEKNGGDKNKGFIDTNITGNDYEYDANGNMILDKNKSITVITYNYLNLPDKVTKNTGEYIKYSYDATGRKLSQSVYDERNALIKKSDYAGEYFYENDTLKFINHEEGRVVLDRDYSQPELVASFDGSSTSAFFLNAGIPGTLSSEQQGGQTYLKFTNATFHWAGPLTNSVAVKAGETYKLRTQGYTTQPDVYVFIMGGDGIDLLWPGANLPLGASNEAWMENTFVVPAGMDHVYLGVIFGDGHPSSADAFYINTIELYKMTNPGPTITNEYQYHLKDHLGNVRTTFTTKEEIEETIATLESEYENTERSQYLKYDDTRRVFDHLFDHTHGVNTSVPSNTPGYSIRLNGSPNERNGIARSISVMPGDKIDMQVFGKFIDPNTPHPDQTAWNNLLAFAADVATAAQTIVIDGVGYTSGTLRLPPYSGVLTDPNESVSFPKAHLNWAIFDRNDKFLDGGAKQLQGGAEDGTDVLFGEINASIDINEPGYVYIWLSNTSAQVMDVYFDDFSVKHTKSPVVQQEEYYPFGLTFNNYQRENATKNNYLYNGKELQDELDLGWMDYGARMYMPEIGRWGAEDPMAHKYFSVSPYNYTLNNPVLFIDPDGRIVEFADGTSKQDKREFMRRQRELNRESKTARQQWRDLKRSDNVHTVHLNEKDKYGNDKQSGVLPKGQIDTAKGNGTDFYLNLKEKPQDGTPQKIIIGHEEAHAMGYDKGKLDLLEPETSFKKSANENTNAMLEATFQNNKLAEEQASHIENIIRAEIDPTGTKIPLRQTYELDRDHISTNGKVTTEKVKINVIKDGYRYYKNNN